MWIGPYNEIPVTGKSVPKMMAIVFYRLQNKDYVVAKLGIQVQHCYH